MSKGANKSKVWSIIGFFAIVTLGFLYHDLFHWTNEATLIGLMAPVNESVWEHLKLGLWAVISFSVIEYLVIRESVNNYFFAKAFGVLVICFTVLAVYYTYTAFLKRNIILLDISSYILGVFLCQLACYKIYQWENSKILNRIGMIVLAASVLLFAFFSFYPPETGLFRDQQLIPME
ncbi:DUF6512 family protein [Lutimonas saemankumensis]|uniref:DUF6512 family protein n=1 Tax=Lutimonas saemankumensis TaxID=483016 RepID=UPI001CD368C0|nr:DUF6512 family protein [Lutimonas saemankumensis]MCA0931364.1 DUF6512 family protein [Lutimonas saemankumensis]